MTADQRKRSHFPTRTKVPALVSSMICIAPLLGLTMDPAASIWKEDSAEVGLATINVSSPSRTLSLMVLVRLAGGGSSTDEFTRDRILVRAGG